jgi:hypothetical protein
MASSSSPTGGAPAPEPPEPSPRPSRSKRTECGYCGCVLDSEGEIISMGKRAKELRAVAENEETRINRITALETEVAELKTKLAAASASPSPSVPTRTKAKSVLDAIVGGG